MVYQPLVPDVIKKIELLAKSNEEHATTALDIFDVLLECEVRVIAHNIIILKKKKAGVLWGGDINTWIQKKRQLCKEKKT